MPVVTMFTVEFTLQAHLGTLSLFLLRLIPDPFRRIQLWCTRPTWGLYLAYCEQNNNMLTCGLKSLRRNRIRPVHGCALLNGARCRSRTKEPTIGALPLELSRLYIVCYNGRETRLMRQNYKWDKSNVFTWWPLTVCSESYRLSPVFVSHQ